VKGQQTYETQKHLLLAILWSRAQQKQAATPNNRKKEIAEYFRCDAVAPSKVVHPQRLLAAGPFPTQERSRPTPTAVAHPMSGLNAAASTARPNLPNRTS
jgi:hypothetical protein